MDSCARDNVMSRRHLQGYRIKPSEGSKRGQKWGSASGHGIYNEGEVTYKFLTESGQLAKGTTQVGEVRRPLAAVSKLTKAKEGHPGQIAFFSEGEDWLIDKRDPLAEEILKLVRKVRRRTKLYEHKGTYRMRAWILPENAEVKKGAVSQAPFGRQGP